MVRPSVRLITRQSCWNLIIIIIFIIMKMIMIIIKIIIIIIITLFVIFFSEWQIRLVLFQYIGLLTN